MYPSTLASFKHIWLCDTEYGGGDGWLPDIRCLVASDLVTGETIRLWADGLETMSQAPFPIGPFQRAPVDSRYEALRYSLNPKSSSA